MVVIKLIDINDNSLDFIFFNSVNYLVNFLFMVEVDSVVVIVIVVDFDKGVNVEIRFYIIEGNSENLFKIDIYFGEIFLVRKIYLYEIKIYDFLFIVTDKGKI